MAKMSAQAIIEKHGGTIKKTYSLINNWGYVVTHDDYDYDVRRWRNCYGSDCGWGVDSYGCSNQDKFNKEWRDALSKDLNDFELNSEW